MAEYAVANKLVSEAAFSWCVPYVLTRREDNQTNEDKVLEARGEIWDYLTKIS